MQDVRVVSCARSNGYFVKMLSAIRLDRAHAIPQATSNATTLVLSFVH